VSELSKHYRIRDTPTQLDLVICYKRGLGVERDMSKAIEQYEKTVEQEYTLALYISGQIIGI